MYSLPLYYAGVWLVLQHPVFPVEEPTVLNPKKKLKSLSI